MKNIAATIQRDQNRVMTIQGVDGSGENSIALHTIAFILYRFRDSLSCDLAKTRQTTTEFHEE